jgi:CBS domain-containing protein
MKIKDVMTKNPVFISPDNSLQDAAQKMQECDCGALLVGENDRLTGMITDRDIVVRAVADGVDITETTVEDVMTDDLVYCYEDQTLEDAADKMEDEQVRRLAVLNREKRLVGIVTLSDIAARSDDSRLVEKIARFHSKQAA